MEKLTGMLSSSSCLTAFVVLSVHRRDDGEDLGTRRQTNVGLMMRTPLSVYDDEELHRTRASLQAGQFSASEKKIDLLRQGVRPEKKEKKTRRRYHPLRPRSRSATRAKVTASNFKVLSLLLFYKLAIP